MRRTGARLLIGLALAAAGGATAALLAPGGAGAASQTPCPQTSAGTDSASCSSTTAAATTTTETTTVTTETTSTQTETTTTSTSTETTSTETTSTQSTSVPTIIVPNGGSGTVQRSRPTSTSTRPAAKPATKPLTPLQAVPAAVPRRGPTKLTPSLGAGTYVFPVYGPISWTDTYGVKRVDVGWHHGDDIFAPLGAPVVAVADGTLYSVGFSSVGGNRLWLRDDAGNYFYYAHLAAFATGAVEGATVRAGEVLGFIGATGDAQGTPPHLHFEVHPGSLLAEGYDGAVDPSSYLRRWQRLQRLRLSGADLLLTTASGWSAAVAAPRPTPGAVLIDSTDISNAQTLNRRSVARALTASRAPANSWAFQQAIKRRRSELVIKLTAKQRLQAARAETLDEGASLPPGFPGGSVWDTLAQCEAGGDWGADTGNGFYGGLQFTASTWRDNGGPQYARFANFASREQQIAVAERVLATQGWIAWPVCSLKLGLR